MKTTRMRLPGKQRGSFYSTAIIVIMFGIFLTTALKIAPTYLDNQIIVNAMEGLIADDRFADMTIAEIRSGLMKTLNTNNVMLSPEDIQLVREGNREYVDINYDANVPLFYNIAAVVSFNNRFDKN